MPRSDRKEIIECVANFSEGRRHKILAEIVAAIALKPDVDVLSVESDVDHNRTVLTFVGAPQAVAEAAFSSIRVAASCIDMRRHRGQHPRIGAADVIPFVPLRNVTMDQCVSLARAVGARVAAELGLPVFLYAEAALQEANRELPAIRRGGYERLRKSIASDQAPQPDFGPRQLGRAGGCIIGARQILIAYNVYLNTTDLRIAKAIARAIRESAGGMKQVRALGLFVNGRAQVSMNLTDYRVTSMSAVFDRLRIEASQFGVAIDSSEIIGLMPRDALGGASPQQLKIANFNRQRLLEHHLGAAEKP